MTTRWRRMAWSVSGMFVGVLLTLTVTGWASRTETNALPLQELRTFADVLDVVNKAYVEEPDNKKLVVEAIRGMVASLDPHSAFLDAEEYRELQVGTQGEFGGLGIEVTMEDGFVKVVSPIEETPAARAGLQAGDLIIKLDDSPVKGMTLRDAVKRMRGEPGTSITLTVLRKGNDKPFTVKITREVIKVRSVKVKRVGEGDVVYVRITNFQETTGPMLAEQLKRETRDGEIKGLVLDLRNDPGGLLHAAIGVSAAFLPEEALVVKTKGRLPDTQRAYHARAEDYLRGSDEQRDYLANWPEMFRTVPMVVLINAGSASASEIVAGALQDHGRAKLLGEKSFGKGSVQTILPLNDGTALKLTTALYYTPSGRSIQAEGIEPDFVVPERENGKRKALREADLQGHIELDAKGQIRRPAASTQPNGNAGGGEGADADTQSNDEGPTKPIEYGSEQDRQFQAALYWLRHGVLPEWAQVTKAAPTQTVAQKP